MNGKKKLSDKYKDIEFDAYYPSDKDDDDNVEIECLNIKNGKIRNDDEDSAEFPTEW